MIIFITFIILLIVAGSFIIKRTPEKWKAIYFSIADDLNSGMDEDKIVIKLQKRHKMLVNDANKAIVAAKNGNEEWFQNKFGK